MIEAGPHPNRHIISGGGLQLNIVSNSGDRLGQSNNPHNNNVKLQKNLLKLKEMA
jgi:hypothetical protein